MMVSSPPRTFEIEPRGAFSLAEANAFGFGQRTAQAGSQMRLAFATDGDFAPAGLELEQSVGGTVHGRLYGDADLDAVVRQTARILSLDHDGRGWEEILAREAPLRQIADRFPGLRPVLFHSPYEGAAWSIISARIHRAQAQKVRSALAAEFGTTFTLHGEAMHAFPAPGNLLAGLAGWDGLNETKRERLLGIAEAADDGQFDVDELHAIGPQATDARMRALKGIGPFYAALITVRSTGFADVVTDESPARATALAAYGLAQETTEAEWVELSDRWRPFRTWAMVLCRVGRERGLV